MRYPVFVFQSFLISASPLLASFESVPKTGYPDPHSRVQSPCQTVERLYRIQNRIDEHSLLHILGIPIGQSVTEPIRTVGCVPSLG